MKNVYKILIRKPERKKESEDQSVDEKMILEWILRKEFGKVWTAPYALGY
jgi:hypothetical protein